MGATLEATGDGGRQPFGSTTKSPALRARRATVSARSAIPAQRANIPQLTSHQPSPLATEIGQNCACCVLRGSTSPRADSQCAHHVRAGRRPWQKHPSNVRIALPARMPLPAVRACAAPARRANTRVAATAALPVPRGNFKTLLSKARAKDAVQARATKTKQGRAIARCAPMATTSPKPTWTACTSSLCAAIPALLASMGQGTTKANARLVLQGSSKMLPGRPRAEPALLVGSAGTWHTSEAIAQRA